MLHTDARFAAAIERVVGEIEACTDAEVVVVAAPSSGDYGDIAWRLAGASAGLALAFLIWSPIVFDAWWFPIDVAGVFLLVGGALVRAPWPLTVLAGASRRNRQVRAAALAAFAEEKVHATTGRTGLLVYVSALEGRVELLPDEGLLGKIPGAQWNALDLRASSVDGLVSGLRRMGTLLAAHIPATGPNPDEIANAPRVRK